MTHDKFFRSQMMSVDTAKEFFNQHLPDQIKRQVNFDKLKGISKNSNFVQRQGVVILSSAVYIGVHEQRKNYHNAVFGQKLNF